MGKLIDVDTIPFFLEENGAVVAYKADIEQLSPVQPEIVRCKDCVWYKRQDCMCPHGLFLPDEDDYCSCATRKEE